MSGQRAETRTRRAIRTAQRGFTLIEVTMATALLACGVSAVAALSLASANASVAARQNGMATVLARAKMEQVRALAWTSDAVLVPVSDWSSDLSRALPAVGGSGLGVSPSGALAANVAGFCDHLDAYGRWVGDGTSAPVAAAWTRRWSIEPLAGAPAGTLRFEVVVLPAPRSAARLSSASRLNGARLIDVRARRAR